MKNIFIIIILIILLAAIIWGAISYTQLGQEKSELYSIEKRIETVNEQILQTKEKVSSLESQNGLLQQKISEFENKLNIYNAQASELKVKKQRVVSDLQNKRAHLANLNEELQNLIRERDVLKSKIDETILNTQNLNDEIAKLSQNKKELEEDIKKFIKPQDAVELEKIVVKLSSVPDGNILEVNDEYGFAVIDIGTEDGVIVGDILNVYRNNELLSKVVVDKVFKDMSSVVPAEGFTDVDLMMSDKVSLSR